MLASASLVRRRPRRWQPAALCAGLGAAVLIAALALAAGGGGEGRGGPAGPSGRAQSGTDEEAEVHVHAGRPTHIYDGSCARLGEVAYPLNPVGAGTMTGPAMTGVAAMPMGDPVGPTSALPVEIGQILVDAPLATISAGQRAINVQISEYEYGNYIACGDLGGAVIGGTLAFGLHEVNGSGFSGVAVLEGQGEATLVTVYLAQGLAGGLGGPVGPPVSGRGGLPG